MINIRYLEEGYEQTVANQIPNVIEIILADGCDLISVTMYPASDPGFWTGLVVYEKRER